MAVHQYTSPSGAVYEFEGPDELTPELQKQIQDSVALNESDTNQGPLATFGNATMQGLAQTATGTVGGVGAVINTLTGSTGEDRSGLSSWADEMQRGAELNFPTNPANPIATGLGQAVGQGVGMMGTSALGLPLGNAKTVARLGLGMAGLMGAQQGEQVADEFGITDPLKRAAMVGGFGVIEGATEAFGGIGSTKFAKSLLKDVPSVLETGIESSAIKRGLKTAVVEGAEEVVSGELQDITTVALASEDPNNPGYSLNGQPLPELASMSTLQNRGLEFLYGMAGGLVPGGVNAAFGTDAGDVMEYRQAVAEKRRDGKVLPEEDERVTQLDTKAQEYLRKAGISDERQASAILAHLQRADKTRDILVAAVEQAEVVAPLTAEALKEKLEQTDRDALLKDLDAAVQAIEPKPVVEEEKPKSKVEETPPAQAPVFSRADDGAYEGMFPSKEAADTWAFDNRDKLTGVTRVSSDGKHYVRARFKDEVNEPKPAAEEEKPKAAEPPPASARVAAAKLAIKQATVANSNLSFEDEVARMEALQKELQAAKEQLAQEQTTGSRSFLSQPVTQQEWAAAIKAAPRVKIDPTATRSLTRSAIPTITQQQAQTGDKVVSIIGHTGVVTDEHTKMGRVVVLDDGSRQMMNGFTEWYLQDEAAKFLPKKDQQTRTPQENNKTTIQSAILARVPEAAARAQGLEDIVSMPQVNIPGNIPGLLAAFHDAETLDGTHRLLFSSRQAGEAWLRQVDVSHRGIISTGINDIGPDLAMVNIRDVNRQTGEGTKNTDRLLNISRINSDTEQIAEPPIAQEPVAPVVEEPSPTNEVEQREAPVTQFTIDDINQTDAFHRVIVGDEAFNDLVNSGQVRTNAATKVQEGMSLADRMAARPTAFPSFSQGVAELYARDNPNHYIVTTSDDSLKPSTSGRHSKGKTFFPTDQSGQHQQSLNADVVSVYKHVGGGKYELVHQKAQRATAEPAPTVEPVSAEEAPEPVVEEPTTVPVAEPDLAPETYEPEPLPPGAQIIQKQQSKSTVAKGRYPVVIYKGEDGKMQQRAHFTNDPNQTFNQIAAGQEISVPQGTKVHPDIKVSEGKVVGVNRSVNGSVRLIENQEQANAAARDDTVAALRSEIQRDTPEVKAAKDAARVAVSGVLPEFPGESAFVDQPLLDRIKSIAAKVPRLDTVARENLESDILSKLVAVKRAGAFIESQPGETMDEKKLSALAAPEVKGNRQLESIIRNYDASQEANLSYIQSEVNRAKAEASRSVQTESLDNPETGVTTDIYEKITEKLSKATELIAKSRAKQLPEVLQKAILGDPTKMAMLADMSPETWEASLKSLSEIKAEQIKPGYRSVREVMEESDRLGLKDGQPKSILTALQRIAENKTGDHYHPHIVYVARALSKLTDSLSKIQDLRFGTANTQHAATYRASDHSITLNLGTPWGEQQTVGEILVHEVGHALTSIKLNDPQTEYDKALANEIESMRQQISDYLTNVRPADAESFAYQLSNADEFVAGVFSNPPFVEMLASLPERLVAGTPVSTKSNFFTNLLRKLWNLMLGKSVTPGSPMERAMDAVFSLAETPFTIPTAENVLSWASIEKNFPAYHGSPYLFDRFSTEKIGTGEGAQAYGWGLYVAESETVGAGYRDKLAQWTLLTSDGKIYDDRKELKNLNVRAVLNKNGSIDEAVARARSVIESIPGTQGAELALADIATLEKLKQSGGLTKTKGNLYTVEVLPDESEFLDWDKPLSEQSEKVKAALSATGLFTQRDLNPPANFVPSPLFNSGRGAYDIIKADAGSPQKASQRLSSLGVAGIKYFDGNSRNIEYGTRNFVIFDDKDVKITHVNGTPVTEQERSDFLDQHLGSSAAPSSKESLPGEHRELIVEAMRALPAGYTLNTDTSSDSPVWVRRSRPGVIFANPGILAAEVAGMNPGRRAELLRSFIEEEVAHTEDLKELGDDEARRIARELAPETRAWINDMYGQDLNDIETVFEGFRMLRQRMRNGATTEEIRAFAASDPNFARRFLEYLRRMWKRLMANLDQDKTLANIKAVRSLVGGIDTLESLAVGEDDTKLGVSPWAWIREQVKPTAGTVTSHRTKAPWFATQDENTPYTATGVMFGSGRKNVSIAEAERVKNATNTAEGRALTVLDRDIKAAAVKTMGSWDAAKALVGEALGNNENRMDYDQRKQYERDHTTAAKAALATYQSSLGTALALENKGDYAQAASVRQAAQFKFKTEVALAKDDFDHKIAQAEQLARQQALARQAAAMAALPTELREAVQRARDRMDALTTEFINKGYGSDDLRATLSKNLGLYLHRSYSAFDSPHWAKWVMGSDPDAVRRRNKVETLVKVDLTAQKAADLIKENPALSHKDAITRAEGLLNDNEIEAKIQELLENSPDEYTSLVQGDGFKNGKPSSVIKRRGEIHPWIQEFWGKHDDPLLNISKSIGLTHAYLAQQSMLRSILNDGVANGYIFDNVGKAKGLVALKDKTEENMRRYPSLFRKDADGKIIGEWFVSPMVRDAIQDLEPESPAKSDSFKAKLWDAYRSLTGYSMAAKTVYSPMALVRDFLSNITLLTIHGHMTPGFAAGPSTWAKSLSANAREVGLDQMLSAIMSPVRGKAPVFTPAQMKKLDALLSRSDELGITGNQMTTSVIKELTKEHSKRFDLRGKDVNRLLKALSSGLHNTAEFFMEWRALSDDIPKLVAWVNETLRTSQFHPEMTQAQAEEAAAKKVRMVMPTYSETSDFIKGWRKQPFFSPFVTFSGEIVRTMINTYKLGAMEMKSTSTAEKLLGFHRIAGMTAMITVLPAIIQSALAKFRPEDDPPVKTDELATALPRFVSGWQKENMLLWLGKEGNKHTYLDLSYLAPYDVIHGILNGTARELFTNPDNVTIPGKVSAALEKAFNEAIKPVAKEQLLTGAIIDTLRNQREPGDKFGLYNDKLATSWEKWTARLSNIWQQALEPGIVKSARGIMKGINQEVDSSGRAYETGNEIRSLFGAKTMSQDIPTRLMRNGNGYARDLSDATMYASQPFSSAGTQDDEALIKAFARMNEAKLKVVGEIRKDWLAAQALGMTAEEATKSLSISHLPKDMVTAAISNEYVREPLSKQLLEKAAANGQALGQDRMALYRRAVEAYPAKQKVLNY